MGEFKAITTQEELEAVLKERLDRKDKQIADKLADHDSVVKERDALLQEKAGFAKTLEDQKKAAETLQQQLDAEKKKTADYELDAIRTRVAIKTKLPLELRDRLHGTDEKSIEADAQEMVKLIGPRTEHKTQPLKETEGGNNGGDRAAALLETLKSVKGE